MGIQNKPKLNIKQQINRLKNNGIKFIIFSESEASKFLQDHSYLFKVKAYCNTFKEKDSNNKTLPYRNLDFALLVDLSTIDMHFRRFIIRLTLDIEHALKTKLMRGFNLSGDNGYDAVKDFLTSSKYVRNFILDEINKTNNNILQKRDLISTNQFILSKYNTDLAIWNFMEIIQFGHLIEFMKFFYSRYPNKNFKKIENSLFNVRCLRNGAAHNNSLLANLKDNIQNPQIEIINEIYRCQIFKNKNRKFIENSMKNITINDFITSLFVYDKVCNSENMKFHCYNDLKTLFDTRFVKKAKLYKDKSILKRRYMFCYRIINYLLKKQTLSNKNV